MEKRYIDPKIQEQVKKLEEKYQSLGQDISSYLEGLLHADYLTYWDYIHLDTLLSLQNTRTSEKDELIFITYHQYTELFFKLIIWEIDQIANHENLTKDFFRKKLERIVRYFENLEKSFDIMVDGLEPEQFLKFRMSLLPASGFQSAQYRLIEIYSTDLHNLVDNAERLNVDPKGTLEDMFQHFYWKKGSTELASGKSTLTLQQFEAKYMETFLKAVQEYREKNLWRIYLNKFASEKDESLMKVMKQYDALANIYWPLSHYRAAVRHLHRDPEDIKATGGTNWQKYLPPRFQRIVFFPDLWTEEELNNWGKNWVRKEVFKEAENT